MPLQFDIYSTSSSREHFIEEFLQFPNKLYAACDSIKKLPVSVEALYFKIHPHAHDFLLIKKEGEVVLRAMICLTPFESLAYFGLIDFDSQNEEVGEILVKFKDWAQEWCDQHKATKLYGPINFSTWLPYRVLSAKDSDFQFSFEPNRPLDYCRLLKEAGFQTNKVYSSTGYEGLSDFLVSMKKDYEKTISLGFSYEFFPEVLEEKDLQDLYQLSIRIFTENHLVTPIDFNTFKHLYVSQSKKEDNSYSLFMLSPSGEKIGFFLAFVENDHIVMKTLGVQKDSRGCGLSNGVVFLSLSKAKERGVTKVCAAMVMQGAQSESYGRKMKLQWTHLYEILELPLG